MSLFSRGTKARALQDQCDRLLSRNADLLQRLHNESDGREADARHAAAVLAGVKAAGLARVEDAEARLTLAEQKADDLTARLDAEVRETKKVIVRCEELQEQLSESEALRAVARQRGEGLERDLLAARDAHRLSERALKLERVRVEEAAAWARKWAQHCEQCPVAQALDAEDASKAADR